VKDFFHRPRDRHGRLHHRHHDPLSLAPARTS
jgi:hypothetical protein